LEIAKQLCEHGCHVILASRSFEHAGIALENFKQLGYDAEYRHLDISDKESIKKFASEINHHFGKLDILVNCAAISFKQHEPVPFEQQARPTVLTNYFGTLWTTEALIPLLRKSGHPRIVNVASEAGHLRILRSETLREAFSSPDLTVERLSELMESFVEAVEAGDHVAKGWPSNFYATSKMAVIALTQVLARDHPGILINSAQDMEQRNPTPI